MGRIAVAMYLTLDGVMEAPAWTMPYWEEQLSDFQDMAQKDADALLLGRVTYQQFAAAWPDSPDEGAAYMNGIGKFVPTSTLEKPAWNARFIKKDALAEIGRLRDAKRLLVYGSGQLVRALFEAGLVDEYREMVFPLIAGKGKKLFQGASGSRAFSLLSSQSTKKGVLLNVYRPQPGGMR